MKRMLGRKRTPSFSYKKEWEKLENNLASLKWSAGEDFAEGVTSIREIAGIIENKLRIFGFESPSHFSISRAAEQDEYTFRFSASGLANLSKKGIKIPGK